MKTRIIHLPVFLSSLITIVAVPMLADTYIWGGAGDGRLWSDPANWSPNGQPGSADAVKIGSVAEPGILISSPASAKTLDLGTSNNDVTYVDIMSDLTTSGMLTAGVKGGASAIVRQLAAT